jgi:hypothetical protein
VRPRWADGSRNCVWRIDAGQRLDVFSSRLSVQGRYQYAFVEEVIDVTSNRSNATVETTYLLTRKWQRRDSCCGSEHTEGCVSVPARSRRSSSG